MVAGSGGKGEVPTLLSPLSPVLLKRPLQKRSILSAGLDESLELEKEEEGAASQGE
jgi:hypothetical protein